MSESIGYVKEYPEDGDSSATTRLILRMAGTTPANVKTYEGIPEMVAERSLSPAEQAYQNQLDEAGGDPRVVYGERALGRLVLGQ